MIDDLPTRLARAEADYTRLKAAQPAGGQSTKAYRTRRVATWDWERTAGGWSVGQTQEDHDIYVKFTADHQDAPKAILVITCLIDNTIYWQASGNTSALYGSVNGVWFNGIVPDVYGSYSPDAPTPNARNEASFYDAVYLTTVGKNIKLKFDVYATDTGTLNIKIDGVLV